MTSICQRDTPCSHLCLIVPGGYKCACPDNKGVKNTYPNCDARKCFSFCLYFLVQKEYYILDLVCKCKTLKYHTTDC